MSYSLQNPFDSSPRCGSSPIIPKRIDDGIIVKYCYGIISIETRGGIIGDIGFGLHTCNCSRIYKHVNRISRYSSVNTVVFEATLYSDRAPRYNLSNSSGAPVGLYISKAFIISASLNIFKETKSLQSLSGAILGNTQIRPFMVSVATNWVST